jgi:hypothetical protein
VNALFADANKLKVGDAVSVTPTDTGKVDTQGILLGADDRVVVIEVEGEAGKLRVHFPRLGFRVAKVSGAKL